MRYFSTSIYFIVFLFSSSILSAQNDNFGLRLKGGVNFSSLSLGGEEISGQRLKTGGNVGIYGNYSVSEKLFLETGLAFSVKGARIKGDAPLGFTPGIVQEGGSKPVLTSNQFYLQLPVQVGTSIPLTPSKELLVKAGPYAAYGVGGKTRLEANILYGDMIDTSPLEVATFGARGLERFDYGLAVGAGVDFGEVVVELNYELGIRDVRPTAVTYFPFYDRSYRNRNLALSVSFKF